jgi:hypothetical protein
MALEAKFAARKNPTLAREAEGVLDDLREATSETAANNEEALFEVELLN